MNILKFIVVIIIFLCPNPVYAFCFEPSSSPPNCTEQLFQDKFEDEWEFSSCKREVESYIYELEEWVNCVASEAEERSAEAIKKFNCKAEGVTFC